MAESQQSWRLLSRWHDRWLRWLLRTAVLAVVAVLAWLVWWRWALAGLAIAGGIALVAGLLAWVVVMPGRLAPPVPTETLNEITDPRARLEVADARTRLRHDLRNGALQLLTVLAVLVGAGLGFQQLAEDRDQARQDRQLTRQGQASERFTRAIDQLGSSRVETRIGGIYGLSQIAEQSHDNTGPVGEVLLAWLNSRSRPRTPPATSLAEHAPDVQAALSVLTGQRYSSMVSYRLDLHGLGLRGANLEGADLASADLEGADLHGAYLEGADLESANLRGAKLARAELNRANLVTADLHGADLEGAFLEGADLTNADLGDADLGDAYLVQAKLYGAYLRGAKLPRANLGGADLGDANLGDADLRSAELPANMERANLYGAYLRGADLRSADLEGADLEGADLRGAKVDGSTRWPPGFDWRRAGAQVAP